MSKIRKPYFLITLSAFIYLLIGCGSTSSPPDDGEVVVKFVTDCELLVCSIDASTTVSSSDTLSSLLCDMGDGNQIDLLTLETIFDHTYAAPGSYDITCSAEGVDGAKDSATETVNIDGLLVNAGPDQTVSANTLVTLDGSASEDSTFPETGNVINRYKWTNFKTTPVASFLSFTNPTSANPTFTPPDTVATVKYEIRLRVSVDDGATYSDNADYIEITVIQTTGGGDL
jgi:hypothetical protein